MAKHNSVTEHEYHPRPWGKDNPYGNVFDVTARTLSRELDACREADGRTGRFWKIINPNQRNAVGKHPGYKLVAQASPVLLAQAGQQHRSPRRLRQQAPVGDALTRKTNATLPGIIPTSTQGAMACRSGCSRTGRSRMRTSWCGIASVISHVCKPEDFPIMPVEYAGFMLKPNNFFAANPAMDLPGEANGHSVQHGEAHRLVLRQDE